jgi:hypothetical protein
MARFEPLGHSNTGPQPGGKILMRRGPDGKLHVVLPARELTETTEAAERPPTPDDPRSSSQQNIPPYGAGI